MFNEIITLLIILIIKNQIHFKKIDISKNKNYINDNKLTKENYDFKNFNV